MVAVLLAVGVAVLAITDVAAHGGEPSIVIVPGRVTVGGTAMLFADELDATAEVAVELVTPDGPLVVTRARTDDAGHLSIQVQLPAHLGPRYYEVRVRVATGQVVTSSLEVVATGTSDEMSEPTWIVPAALGGLLVATSAAVVAALRGREHRQEGGRRG